MATEPVIGQFNFDSMSLCPIAEAGTEDEMDDDKHVGKSKSSGPRQIVLTVRYSLTGVFIAGLVLRSGYRFFGDFLLTVRAQFCTKCLDFTSGAKVVRALSHLDLALDEFWGRLTLVVLAGKVCDGSDKSGVAPDASAVLSFHSA